MKEDLWLLFSCKEALEEVGSVRRKRQTSELPSNFDLTEALGHILFSTSKQARRLFLQGMHKASTAQQRCQGLSTELAPVTKARQIGIHWGVPQPWCLLQLPANLHQWIQDWPKQSCPIWRTGTPVVHRSTTQTKHTTRTPPTAVEHCKFQVPGSRGCHTVSTWNLSHSSGAGTEPYFKPPRKKEIWRYNDHLTLKRSVCKVSFQLTPQLVTTSCTLGCGSHKAQH